jgi:hypothetical protein
MFDLPEHVREPVRGPQADEQVDAIGDAAHRFGHTAERVNRSAEEGVKSCAPIGFDQRAA